MGVFGVKATVAILDDLREKVKANHVKEPAECKQLLIDSDNDTIHAKVEQVGAACHTGNRTCYYRTLAE